MTRLIHRPLAVASVALFLVVPVASCSLDLSGQPTTAAEGAADGGGSDAITDALAETSLDGAPDVTPDVGACVPVPPGWSLARVLTSGNACAPTFAGPITFIENPSVGTTPCTCSCGPASSNPCLAAAGVIAFHVRLDTDLAAGCASAGGLTTSGTCQSPVSWSKKVVGVQATPAPPQNVACAATPLLPPLTGTARFDACIAPGFRDAGADASDAAGAGTCAPIGSGACVAKAGVEPTCPGGFGNRRVVSRASEVVDQRTCGACSCSTTATACTNATLSLFESSTVCGGVARVASLDGVCNPFNGDFDPQALRYDATPVPNACAPASATSAVGGTVTSSAQTTICCAP